MKYRLRNIYDFIFNEVGYLSGYINLLINKLIYFNSHTNLKKNQSSIKVINAKHFTQYGWSKIKFNSSLQDRIMNYVIKIDKTDNVNSFKNYWKEIFNEEIEIKNFVAHELKKTDIFDFALNYFGSIPMLRSINCFYTKGREDLIFSSSMNWHKDLHHEKLIKIMYCVSDIDEENGPTNFIDTNDSAKIKYTNFPHYFSDKELKSQNKKFTIKKCLGKSGDAFALDTAQCFHMGSRSKKDRMQVIITISPYASKLYPFKSIHIDKDLFSFNQSLYKEYKSS